MIATFPAIPESAPFSAEQRAWLNGFLAGLYSRSSAEATPPTVPLRPLTLLFGSQTGTAERLAKKAAKIASKRGFAPTVLDANGVDLNRLKSEGTVLAILSTYGDGEPPDSAVKLLQALRAADGMPLTSLSFSVCALGDSKYPKFCQAGKDLEAALLKLGGRRLLERMDCDVGEDEAFSSWLDRCLGTLAGETGSEASKSSPMEAEDAVIRAPILSVKRLSGPDSAKEVNHVVFDLEGTGLSYQAGDALAVTPTNATACVTELLSRLDFSGEERVTLRGQSQSLRAALTSSLDLGKPTAKLLSLLGVGEEATVPHLIDAAERASKKASAQEFVDSLKPLRPRLYSISSSPKAHPQAVHLTVGTVSYELAGRKRDGVCSSFLATRALGAGPIAIAVHPNNSFRLPPDPATPIIMIGPGTGIAPFMAFLQEREATQAPGRNWLFFGDQREATDFLYRDQLLAWREKGLLTRLDLAWSREHTHKVYVQHRLREAATELWSWLEDGAHVYICGDAARMAKDVHAALVEVIEKAGAKTAAEAKAYLEQLAVDRRYQRDVY